MPKRNKTKALPLKTRNVRVRCPTSYRIEHLLFGYSTRSLLHSTRAWGSLCFLLQFLCSALAISNSSCKLKSPWDTNHTISLRYTIPFTAFVKNIEFQSVWNAGHLVKSLYFHDHVQSCSTHIPDCRNHTDMWNPKDCWSFGQLPKKAAERMSSTSYVLPRRQNHAGR